MKNDAPKPLLVVLLDADGNPWPGVHETACEGKAGFRLKGRQRVYLWADEGKTWKRAEESR